jgi:hypothetical protein
VPQALTQAWKLVLPCYQQQQQQQQQKQSDEGWRSLAFHWSDNSYFYLGEALFAAPSF